MYKNIDFFHKDINNSDEAEYKLNVEKDVSFFCWLNDIGSVILSSKQDKNVHIHHI